MSSCVFLPFSPYFSFQHHLFLVIEQHSSFSKNIDGDCKLFGDLSWKIINSNQNLGRNFAEFLGSERCTVRAECIVHLFFSSSPRPRCIAAGCCSLHRGFVFRPDDAVQKRFSWFSDLIQAVERSALCRSRRELSNEFLFATFGFDTAGNEPCKLLTF